MKLGLKLWSTNSDCYLKEAAELYEQGIYDYIELYIVPNTLETISKWKTLEIPFTLHASHAIHDVNLADESKEKYNIEVFKQIEGFFYELNAGYVVVHSGIEGNIEETVRQLKIITAHSSQFTAHFLIENKPFLAPKKNNRICRGATIEEVSKVINEVNCGFCLDIGHAICTANSLKLEPYEYLNRFNKLNPTCYHLSDNFIDTEIDKHLHFGQGDYDLKKIFDIIDADKNIAIETNKDSEDNLDDFVEDIKWLKNLK